MQWSSKRWAVILGVVGIVAVGTQFFGKTTEAQGTDNPVVGIVQIAQHPSLDEANRGFVAALQEAYPGKAITIMQENAQGEQSNLKAIAQRFVSQNVQLIGAISTPAAQTMANETATIPIVGTAVSDYESAKLVKTNAAPGTNVTGTSDRTPETEQVQLLQRLLPTAKRVGIIYNSGEINSELQAKSFVSAAQAKGLSVTEATVSNVNDLAQVAQALSGRVDVIYVPTDNVIASALPTLINVTNAARIPVIGAAASYVQEGALAAFSVDYYQIGYRAGEMAVKILKGNAQPQTLAIELPAAQAPLISRSAASTLGIAIDQELAKTSQLCD